jgi:putative ABC transport system permease protein
MTGIRAGIRRIFHGQWRDPEHVRAEMDEEIGAHLAARAADLRAQGYPPPEAEAEAVRRFGAMEEARPRLHQSALQRSRRFEMADAIDALRLDLRYAVRGLVAHPAFTLGVCATLALGVGVNSVVVRLVDRLFLWSPAVVHDPAGLRQLVALRPDAGAFAERRVYSWPEYAVLRDAGIFGAIAASTPAVARPIDQEASALVSTIGPGYLEILGVRPALGRAFSADELQPDAHIDVALISDALWNGRFGGDAGVVGRNVDVAGRRYRIVGVMPRGFAGIGLDPVDLWTPLGSGWFGSGEMNGVTIPWYQTTGALTVEVVTRRRSGMSDATTTAALAALHRGPRPALRDPVTLRTLVANRTSGTGEFADNVKVLERVALVAVLVLLLAVANATNLVLSRGLRRRQEIAVRLALGVSRGRLIRQLVIEAAVLSIISTTAALAAGGWAGEGLRSALFPDARWSSAMLDGRTLVATILIAAVIALIIGTVPAWQATQPDLVATLKGAPVLAGRRSGRLRDGLVVLQVTLSVALLVGTGMFVRSLQQIATADIGMVARDLVAVSIPSPRPSARAADAAIPTSIATESIADWLSAVEHVAGVQRSAATSVTPFDVSEATMLSIPGRDSLPDPGGLSPLLNGVTPEYRAVVGLHLLRGRWLATGDNAGSDAVVVVNRSMAQSYWPGVDPVGQCIRIGGASHPCAQVIGVVADLRDRPKGPALLRYYVPFEQMPSARPFGAVMLRTAPGMAASVAAAVRTVTLHGVHPRDVVMAGARAERAARPWRLGSVLFGLMGALALALSAVGLCSVLLCVFAERTRELGIRMALGAKGRDITWLVTFTGLRLVGAGWAAGLIVGIGTARAIRAMLVGVSVFDPLVYIGATAALLAAALIATMIPAHRARRADPVDVLRET